MNRDTENTINGHCRTFEDGERFKYLAKIRKLANAEHTPETMQLSSKADKVLLPWKQLKHSNTGPILKVQPYQLKGLEKVNGIQFYDIQSTITEGSETSRAIKKTITKGRCRDLEFILTRCSDTKGITSIDIQVDVDHASSLSHFLQATIKSNDLSLFFRSIKRYARVIEKRKKIFEEVLCNYCDHVVMPRCAHPSSFYFLPMKNNPQFQLMFLWDILVEDNGALHQKISLLPLLSKKYASADCNDEIGSIPNQFDLLLKEKPVREAFNIVLATFLSHASRDAR